MERANSQDRQTVKDLMRSVRNLVNPHFERVVAMNDIIYLVGLVVVVMFILSVIGVH
jgi:hypothetical protein